MADHRSLSARKKTVSRVIKKLEMLQIAEKYPAFVPVLKALQKRIDKINTLPFRKSEEHLSELKKSIRHSLAKAAHHVSCGVYCYAQITRNAVMKSAVRYSESDFFRPQEDTIIGRVRQIINAFKKVKKPSHYGLTPKVINELHLQFKRFMEIRNLPAIRVKKLAQALRHADKLMDQCFEIIEHQLEPLIVAVSQNEDNLAKRL